MELYFSFVFSKIYHCAKIFRNALKSYLNPLQVIQKEIYMHSNTKTILSNQLNTYKLWNPENSSYDSMQTEQDNPFSLKVIVTLCEIFQI